MQPMRVSVAASTRNWNMISPRVAPSALRTPISRVRSVTEIIMIATTPTPPTMSPTLDSVIMAMKKPLVIWLNGVEHPVLGHEGEVVVVARLESTAARRAAVTWSWVCTTVASSVGITAISIQPGSYSATLRKVVCGIASRGSSALQKSDAASACTPITSKGTPKILIFLPMRIEAGEQGLGQLVVDDRHVDRGRVLDLGEVAPREDVAAVHLDPGRTEAGDGHALQVHSLVGNRTGGVFADVDVPHRGKPPDQLGFLQR